MKAENSYFSNFIMCAQARAHARANFTFHAYFISVLGWTCHFWKTAQKNLNLQISIFSKIASFNPNLIIFFPVKPESSYFSNFIMHARPRARARAKISFSENSSVLGFSVNFQHSKWNWRARVLAGARAPWNLKSMNFQLSLEKKLINLDKKQRF